MQETSFFVKQRRAAYVFIAPNFISFIIFFVIPALYGVRFSLSKYDGWTEMQFVGLNNYIRLFSDPSFYKVLTQTFLFVLLTVPLLYVVSLGFALLLTHPKILGKGLLRANIYWPTMISTVIIGLMFRWIFGQNFGIVNYLISLVGGPLVPWLTTASLARMIVILASVWWKTGFFMLIFIGALESIPAQYYEAASIDGADSVSQFKHITLPLLKPTSLLVMILSTIEFFKTFPLVVTLTNGGPAGATTFIVQYIYKTGLVRFKIGYACAVSMVMFDILAALTIIQFKFKKGGAIS